ncbi:MAG: tetratricopeptide repeat protein [Acidobacteriota bacterium]
MSRSPSARPLASLLMCALVWGCASTRAPEQATVLEFDPADPLTATRLMQQGQALVKEGKVDDGLVRYRAALKSQPSNPTIHNLMGAAELQRGNAAAALELFNQALQLAPTYSDARNNRGAAYVQLNQFSMAETDFLTVLADNLYENRTGVYFNLGSLYHSRGNLLAAEENLRRAAVASGPIDAYLLLARVQEQLGKHEFAETTLRQGMIRAPERADIVLALAQLLEKEGRTNESLELYRRILNLAPHSPEAEQARAKVGR